MITPRRTTILLPIVLLISFSSAFAGSLYWDSNGTGIAGAGTTPIGTWGTSNFWNTSSTGLGGTFQVTTALTDDLFFSAGTDATGTFTVTTKKNTDVFANSITIEEGTVTLSGDSSGTGSIVNIGGGGITINSGTQFTIGDGNPSLNIALQAAQSWTNNSSNLFSVNVATANGGNLLTIGGTGNTTISGVISGAGGLTKSGAGTLTLNGANTFTGLTTVSAGTLVEGVNNALSSGALTVNGATAVFDLGASHGDSVGTVTVDGGGSITGTGTSTLTSTNSFEMKNGSVSAILAGSGIALNKTTSGTVTLSGANTYTGTTTVSAGTLLVNGNQSTATGAVNVNNSGTILGGTGTIGGKVTVGSGAILLGGTGSSASGTLTVSNTSSGAITLQSGSIIELALGGSHTHSTIAHTGSGTISFSSTQAFAFIDLGATTGTYDNIITGTGLSSLNTSGWTISNPGWSGTFTLDGTGNIDLTLTAVPEPSTWIGGALALLAIGCTQRKRFARFLKRA